MRIRKFLARAFELSQPALDKDAAPAAMAAAWPIPGSASSSDLTSAERGGPAKERIGAKAFGIGNVVLISPGGLGGRGGMATVTQMIAEWLGDYSGVEVKVLDARGGGSPWFWPAHFLSASIQLIGLRILRGTSVLHLQVSERSSFIRKGLLQLLGQVLGMTVILHHHGAELIPFYQTAPAPLRWWTRFIIRHADMNLVLGERWLKFLQADVGVRKERTKILYNASLDLEQPVELARTHHISQTAGGLRVLVMANLSPRKGISEFLSAIKILSKTHGDLRVTLAGGGEVERYIKEADALGLSSLCTFTGWIDRSKIAGLMAESDCLVLPSYEEGLPMAILEALSCKVPVIATPVGSIPEVLTDKVNCLFVEPGNVDELACALRKLAQDPDLRASLAENGRRLFDQRFKMDAYMSEIMRIYARAVRH